MILAVCSFLYRNGWLDAPFLDGIVDPDSHGVGVDPLFLLVDDGYQPFLGILLVFEFLEGGVKIQLMELLYFYGDLDLL